MPRCVIAVYPLFIPYFPGDSQLGSNPSSPTNAYANLADSLYARVREKAVNVVWALCSTLLNPDPLKILSKVPEGLRPISGASKCGVAPITEEPSNPARSVAVVYVGLSLKGQIGPASRTPAALRFVHPCPVLRFNPVCSDLLLLESPSKPLVSRSPWQRSLPASCQVHNTVCEDLRLARCARDRAV